MLAALMLRCAMLARRRPAASCKERVRARSRLAFPPELTKCKALFYSLVWFGLVLVLLVFIIISRSSVHSTVPTQGIESISSGGGYMPSYHGHGMYHGMERPDCVRCLR